MAVSEDGAADDERQRAINARGQFHLADSYDELIAFFRQSPFVEYDVADLMFERDRSAGRTVDFDE